MPGPLLDVIDLRKSYGPIAAHDGVSFQVSEGEVFGLLGPNGAGKTSLLGILSCLAEPTVGVDPQSRILIFEEVRRLNASGVTVVYTSHYMEEVEALCSRIGIIDQGKLRACDTLAGLLRMLRGLIRCRLSPLTPQL